MEFSKKFYESILNGMLDLVRVIDIDGVVVFCNTKMKEEFGDQTGKKCYELFCKDSRCEDCIAIRSIRENTRFMKYTHYKDKTYYVISSPVCGQDGKVVGTVEVFRDITEQKKIEERLRRQNEILRRDLEFAKRLQQSLLPVIPRIEGYRITYTYKPCERLGGDFLDVINIDDKIVFYVADVAGHGLFGFNGNNICQTKHHQKCSHLHKLKCPGDNKGSSLGFYRDEFSKRDIHHRSAWHPGKTKWKSYYDFCRACDRAHFGQSE